MLGAPPPQSIILIHRKPPGSRANRLKTLDKRIVCLDRLLNQIVRRLTNADGLHQLATDVKAKRLRRRPPPFSGGGLPVCTGPDFPIQQNPESADFSSFLLPF